MSRVILFLPLVVGPSPIRGYAHSHSAEVTHSFIQQSITFPPHDGRQMRAPTVRQANRGGKGEPHQANEGNEQIADITGPPGTCQQEEKGEGGHPDEEEDGPIGPC